MNIVSVIPITKNSAPETLTYFSAKDVELGMLVYIPLRKQTVLGIVTEIKKVETEKSSIKSSHFNLRKIEKIIGPSPFKKELINTAKILAPYYATNMGSILTKIIPNDFIEKIESLKKNEDVVAKKTKSEIFTYQAPKEEREGYYKTLIRESFAKKESVFFIVPSIHQTKIWFEIFKKGIERHIYVYSSNLSKKEKIKMWDDIKNSESPVLVIGTPQIILFQRNDIGSIILENEHNDAYNIRERPYFDFREVVKTFAKELHTPLILGGRILRITTLAEGEKEKYQSIGSKNFRFPELANLKLTPLKNDLDKFTLFSRPLEKVIREIHETKQHLFIFVARKGVAPITLCGDCKKTVSCKECGTPLVLYNKKGQRVYHCNGCGFQSEADMFCENCSSWNLIPLGIGSEKVLEEVKSLNQSTQIFFVDSENTPTERDVKNQIKGFEESEHGILIATEKAFEYLPEKIDKIAIASIDTFFALPDFRINEKIINLILKLQEHTDIPLLIQTNHPEEPLFDHFERGSLLEWYKEEIGDRKLLKYPPYGVLLTIESRGNKAQTQKQRNELEEILHIYRPSIITKKIGTRDEYVTHALMKLKLEEWPEYNSKEDISDIQKLISNLPPYFTIYINREYLP